jgi:YggT family protein
MIAVINFIGFVGDAILSLLIFAIFANAILSWLVAFDVVNLRNRYVYQISRFLEQVCRPILLPFQKVIPPLGGIDITPLIALIVLQGIKMYLWPAFIAFLAHIVGG